MKHVFKASLKFKIFAAALMLVMSCGRPNSNESHLQFYSEDAYEAEIKLNDYFVIPSERLSKTYDKVEKFTDLSKEDQAFLRETLDLQIKHLFGVFTYHKKPTDFANLSGAILEKGSRNITGLEMTKSQLTVKYHYVDKGVFYYQLFTAQEQQLRFYMPNSPLTIYKDTLPKNGPIDKVTKQVIHPCTDRKDNSELAFWYYWSPDRFNCKNSFKQHLHMTTADFKILPSTESTFPEYQKLYQGRDKTLRIDLLVGQDQYFGKKRDLGYITFTKEVEYFRNLINKNGESVFTILRDDPHFKTLGYKTSEFSAELNIRYIDTETETFDKIAKKSLYYSDIFIFSGHSYEGYYFDLKRLFGNHRTSLNKRKYQVMFFNSCTTYAYYHEQFFEAKQQPSDPKGTRDLDIITNGIGAPFLLNNKTPPEKVNTADTILITNLLGLTADGKELKTLNSWQQILGQITENAGYDFTALTNIKGDEDNPKSLSSKIVTPLQL